MKTDLDPLEISAELASLRQRLDTKPAGDLKLEFAIEACEIALGGLLHARAGQKKLSRGVKEVQQELDELKRAIEEAGLLP